MVKHFITILLCSVLGLFAIAQVPQGIPYQAIARNSSGTTLASTSISVRFTIRDSIATGAIKYRETFSVTTTAQGMFNVNVGQGTVVSGSFAGINWGTNAKFLQVELDPLGGSSYIDMGTTQMMSVPYALFSGSISNNAIGQPHIQVFTSSGTFTTSEKISSSTTFKITVVGGGGSGGAYFHSGSPGYSTGPAGGGGAGGTAIYYSQGLNPLSSYSVTVGAGGALFYATSLSSTGNSGGNSAINLGSTTITAFGGIGGTGGISGSPNCPCGGNGGNAINGTINLSGGKGNSAGIQSDHNYLISINSGGISAMGGSSYGGGGSSADYCPATCSSPGQAGQPGIVIIEWIE